MTEKLALDQSLGNRRAVDLDEGLIQSLAVEENFIRDQLLAGAIFATDHHRGIRAADPLDQLFQTNDHWAFPDDFPPRDAVPIQEIRYLHRTLKLRCLFHHQIDLGHGKRLRHIVKSPRAHALHHRLDTPIRRDHYHDRLGLAVRHPLDKNTPVPVGEFHI